VLLRVFAGVSLVIATSLGLGAAQSDDAANRPASVPSSSGGPILPPRP
jgi:hypothetical protein